MITLIGLYFPDWAFYIIMHFLWFWFLITLVLRIKLCITACLCCVPISKSKHLQGFFEDSFKVISRQWRQCQLSTTFHKKNVYKEWKIQVSWQFKKKNFGIQIQFPIFYQLRSVCRKVTNYNQTHFSEWIWFWFQITTECCRSWFYEFQT